MKNMDITVVESATRLINQPRDTVLVGKKIINHEL